MGMNLWSCKNCGAAFREHGPISVAETDKDDGYYIEKGVCPGCGGKGYPVEKVE